MARKRLSWIVGRDTEKLTEEEVTKATVETIAENTADGTIAPMLYMFIGGAPLAFLYKGINTMKLEDVKAFSFADYKKQQYDILADYIRNSVDMKEIYRIIEEGV